MIRVVHGGNAALYRAELDQLRTMLLQAERSGDGSAALKRRRCPI